MVPPNHPMFNRVFHYKPSILGYPGYPYFWKQPVIPPKTAGDNRGSLFAKPQGIHGLVIAKDSNFEPTSEQ